MKKIFTVKTPVEKEVHAFIGTFLFQSAYTLCNMCSHSKEFCQDLLREGALQGMVPLLKVADLETVQLSLAFCEMILCNTDNVSGDVLLLMTNFQDF